MIYEPQSIIESYFVKEGERVATYDCLCKNKWYLLLSDKDLGHSNRFRCPVCNRTYPLTPALMSGLWSTARKPGETIDPKLVNVEAITKVVSSLAKDRKDEKTD